MEFDDAKGEYRVNPLGVKQLEYELEMLEEMTVTSYKQAFVKYAQTDLLKGVQQYRFDVLMDWLNTHLNQPMPKEEMYKGIMLSKVFTEYKGRPMGQKLLNSKLQIYGFQIVSVRDKKRVKNGEKNDCRDRTLWKLIQV